MQLSEYQEFKLDVLEHVKKVLQLLATKRTPKKWQEKGVCVIAWKIARCYVDEIPASKISCERRHKLQEEAAEILSMAIDTWKERNQSNSFPVEGHHKGYSALGKWKDERGRKRRRLCKHIVSVIDTEIAKLKN